MKPTLRAVVRRTPIHCVTTLSEDPIGSVSVELTIDGWVEVTTLSPEGDE